jgi:FAD/FMN-containing dehydrogenase
MAEADPDIGPPDRRAFLRFTAAAGGASLLSVCSKGSITSGAGSTAADPTLATWRQAYYGANYTRLTQVKAAYDPDHVFSFPQGV